MVTTAERTSRTGNGSKARLAETQTQRYARLVFRGLAALFVAGVGSQFFIVGMALFVDGSRWNLHQMVGHASGIIPLLMFGAALLGRMPLTARMLSLVLLIQVVMQQVTVSIGDWAGALHPLNAILMFAIGLHVLRVSVNAHTSVPIRIRQESR
jgi:hypothetical protein